MKIETEFMFYRMDEYNIRFGLGLDFYIYTPKKLLEIELQLLTIYFRICFIL